MIIDFDNRLWLSNSIIENSIMKNSIIKVDYQSRLSKSIIKVDYQIIYGNMGWQIWYELTCTRSGGLQHSWGFGKWWCFWLQIIFHHSHIMDEWVMTQMLQWMLYDWEVVWKPMRVQWICCLFSGGWFVRVLFLLCRVKKRCVTKTVCLTVCLSYGCIYYNVFNLYWRQIRAAFPFFAEKKVVDNHFELRHG